MPSDAPWWHATTIYQVYPRSFADSDGDGIGDLPGIVERLDHLADLGIGTVWVSPFFASPQRDVGYDVSDYCAVAPEYGGLADAERLIDEAHRRGMKVMFDLVLNHTSDEHPWFVESRSSRTNPKADWYVWADGRGKDGRRPPNNWRGPVELRSAWHWCEEREQLYLASFLPFQPDLNWRNPEVRAEMFDAVRFWLDRGVDGFRLDIFGQIMKDPALRSNPLRPGVVSGLPRIWRRVHTENTDENIQLAKDLRAVCAEYDDPERILLGEVFGPPSVLRRYLGDDREPGLQLTFLFDFLRYRYDAGWFRSAIARFERSFPAPLQPTYVLENHDRSRSLSRVGGDLRKARALAVLLCTVRGVPTIYMGQEVGMTNTYLPLRDAIDPLVSEYFSWIPEVVNRRLDERVNRDEVRTPMQWDASRNAGFCPDDVEPWLPVNPDHATRNVAAQAGVDGSLLELYRSLLHLRRDRPALHGGSLTLVDVGDDDVLAFEREADGERLLVLIRFGDEPGSVSVEGSVEVLLASDDAVTVAGAGSSSGATGQTTVTLPPHAGAVLALDPAT